MAMDIKTIYMTCFEGIGADGSKAVQTYYAEKNAPITRQQFFEKAKWAILVSGVTRKGAEKTRKKLTRYVRSLKNESRGRNGMIHDSGGSSIAWAVDQKAYRNGVLSDASQGGSKNWVATRRCSVLFSTARP